MLLGQLVETYERYQKPVSEFWIFPKSFFSKTQKMLLFPQFWSDVAG